MFAPLFPLKLQVKQGSKAKYLVKLRKCRYLPKLKYFFTSGDFTHLLLKSLSPFFYSNSKWPSPEFGFCGKAKTCIAFMNDDG